MNPEHISTIIQRVLPARRGIMLCKKCQIWADTIQVKSHQPPWQHCHHELEQLIEPGEEDVIKWAEDHYWDSLQKDKALIIKHIKESFCSGEKPKEKCWCENDVRMTKIWGQIGNVQKGWDILYCPYCAKKL